MGIGWSDLTFSPDEVAIAALEGAWAWLLPEGWSPLLFSVLGDMFFEQQTVGVFWLNTGTGTASRVAKNVDEFRAALGTEVASDWFLPPLIEKLHESGKIPGPGCCYTYAILPVFEEGKYEVWNLNVVPAREHFALAGELHAKINRLPDKSRVQIAIVP
jgi:hypothetical protein